MSTVQEQLMLKRVPLDKWSVRELLSLSSSVLRSGNQNWVSVSRAVRVFGEASRPEDWFSQKNCAVQYSTMLEKAETPKRKKRANNSSEKEVGPVETVGETIVRQYTLDRMEELKQILEDDRAEYLKLQREVELLQTGAATEEQIAAWLQEEENKKKQKELDGQNHGLWLQERERRKAQLERAWKPVPTASRRKLPLNSSADTSIQSDADTSVDSTITALFNTDVLGEDSSEPKTVPSAPTSPFLTSLLKNPSPSKLTPSSSILHSAITSQRGSTPTITSLLSSSPSVPQPHVKTYLPSQDEAVPTLSMLLKLPPGGSEADGKTIGPATGSLQYPSLQDGSIHLPPHQQYHLAKSQPPNENELVNAICDDMEPIEIGLEEIIADLEQGGSSDVGKDLADDVVTQLVTQSSVDTFHKIFDDFYAMNVKKQDSVEAKPPDYGEKSIYERAIPEKSLEVSIEESLPDIKITDSEVKQLQGEKVIDLFSDDLLVVQEILEHEDVIMTQGSSGVVDAPVETKVEPVETPTELPAPPVNPQPEVSVDVSASGVQEVKDVIHESAAERTVDTSDTAEVIAEPKTVKSRDSSKDSKKNTQNVKAVDTETEAQLLVSNTSALKLLADYSDLEDEDEDEEQAEEAATKIPKEEEQEKTVIEDDDSSILKSEPPRPSETDETSTDVESSLKHTPELKSPTTKTADEPKVMEGAEDSRDKSVMSGCEDSSEATELSSEYSNQEKPPVMLEVETTPKAESSGIELLTNAKRLLRRAGTPAFDSLPSSPASVTTDEEKEYRAWKKSIMLVWNSLAAHKYASVFLRPITDEQAPHYSNTCYAPTDLSLIKRNIETGVIRTTAEFHREILRMSTNAVMYNGFYHDIHKIALEIRLDCQQQIQDYIKTQQLIQSPGDRATMRRETRMTDATMALMNASMTMHKRKRDSDVNKSTKKRKVQTGNP